MQIGRARMGAAYSHSAGRAYFPFFGSNSILMGFVGICLVSFHITRWMSFVGGGAQPIRHAAAYVVGRSMGRSSILAVCIIELMCSGLNILILMLSICPTLYAGERTLGIFAE